MVYTTHNFQTMVSTENQKPVSKLNRPQLKPQSRSTPVPQLFQLFPKEL